MPWPSHLHKPYSVAGLENDDLALLGISFFFVYTMCPNVIAMLCIPVPEILYFRAKKKNPRGFFKHLSYSTGIRQLHGYPSYFQKEFYE